MSDYFPFELSKFQTDAINAIKQGNHCLVTAHTGSGKTVPAEFAIQYFTSMGKRVIYTSPIKALSNQKLHDFRTKYPHISFGIVTGDIEDNKEAQVLIMTTEILSNSLLHKNLQGCGDGDGDGDGDGQTNYAEDASEMRETAKSCENTPFRFTMDYDNDLAAVVFDEVHYISDSARGQAWEQSMMLLPKSVVFVMLSATIANPFTLVNWIESITYKEVCLASTVERVVPLKHYVYVPSMPEKKLAKLTPDLQSSIREFANELVLIKEGEGQTFNQSRYEAVYNLHSQHMNDAGTPVGVLPELIKKLRAREMLPVLVFVFNRNQTEVLADKLCASGMPSLFKREETTGHDITGKIEKECRHLLSRKMPNYEDFLECAEFKQLIACVGKGVAYHHAGMMPVLRELVEFLDAQGYVKVLFATETFAVGVNMPTRTVVFTSLTKYTEEGERLLMPHEYTQMAGRAGRRGLDKEGNCIILSPALCGPGSLASILTGRPATITSNYRISYHLILGCLTNANANTITKNITEHISYDELVQKALTYSHNSLSAPNQRSFINKLRDEYNEMSKRYDDLYGKKDDSHSHSQIIKTPLEVVERYTDIEKKLASGMVNAKMTKQLTRERYKLCQENFYLERDYELLKKQWKHETELKNKKRQIKEAEEYVLYEIKAAIYVLITLGFIKRTKQPSTHITEDICTITELGKFALSIYEAHPLGLPMYLNRHHGFFKDFAGNLNEKAIWLAQFLSIFCDVKETDRNLHSVSTIASGVVADVECAYNAAYDTEMEACGGGQFYLTQNYQVQGVLFKYIDAWCRAKTTQDCREVIWEMNADTGVSTGDFIKSIMKIIKLSKELMSGAEACHNLVLMSICTRVPENLLKYLATTQSLYV